MRNKLSSVITLAVATIFAISLIGCKSSNQDNSIPNTQAYADEYNSFIMDSLVVEGSPFVLFEPKLTSIDYICEKADMYYEYDSLGKNPDPVEDAFFIPEPDIKINETVKNVQRRFNYVAVGNVVSSAEQLFYRLYLNNYPEYNPGEHMDLKRELVSKTVPDIPMTVLNKAFPDAKTLRQAQNLINAYKKYDGDDVEGSPFWDTFNNYRRGYAKLPGRILPENSNKNRDSIAFRRWYDKNSVVPGIEILSGWTYSDRQLSEIETQRLLLAVQSEKNIDKRTLLAIELLSHDREDGVYELGQILESGIYTKYLYEAWEYWRSSVQQLYFGVSSSSFIPDNYYSKIKAKCVNTILRHIQQAPNEDHYFDLVVIEYLITTESLDRFGSVFGNESILS